MLREYNIVIMGGGGVGKSSLTVRFVHSLFVEKYDPTIEDSYRKIVTVDGVTVTCNIMDTAGTEQFMALHSMYIKSGDGFILVFSLTSMESVGELASIREQIMRMKAGDGARRPVPLVLVGNKCDLLSERQVSRDAAVNLSRAWRNTPYYETSAKKEINVHEVFDDVLRQCIAAGAQESPRRSGRPKKTRKCTIL